MNFLKFLSRLFGSRTSMAEVQQVDLRSEDYKKLEREAVAFRPKGSDFKQLLSLLEVAHQWGREHKWPVFEEYPQYGAIREIGQRLHDGGGLQKMQKIGLQIKARNGELGSFLDGVWDGVGDWRW